LRDELSQSKKKSELLVNIIDKARQYNRQINYKRLEHDGSLRLGDLDAAHGFAQPPTRVLYETIQRLQTHREDLLILSRNMELEIVQAAFDAGLTGPGIRAPGTVSIPPLYPEEGDPGPSTLAAQRASSLEGVSRLSPKERPGIALDPGWTCGTH
jgi:hypothetical protein